MSQNAHTLHLFFDEPLQAKVCHLMLHHLCAGNPEKARRLANDLGGINIDALWNPEEFFNGSVEKCEPGLLLKFDSSTREGVALRLLETLFAHGLRSAVAEVFYDQSGETERMHFEKGLWVSRQAFYERNPTLHDVVNGPRDASESGDEGEDSTDGTRNPRKPTPIAKLRAQQEEQERQGQEAAEAVMDLFKGMREAGVSPAKGVVSLLLLRAGFKGLMQAVLFTVVTVLLFKGFWLWMGLGLALMVALPLYRISAEYKSLQS